MKRSQFVEGFNELFVEENWKNTSLLKYTACKTSTVLREIFYLADVTANMNIFCASLKLTGKEWKWHSSGG
jgi:hypothetical protein